jgi:NAD(P)-dependent dehydrogenase (short-subunit alcohol dehydrogenase family)
MARLTVQDKAAVVTGGGSGIGRAIALALAGGGARVAVVGRRRQPLEETAAAAREAGGRCLVCELDVTDGARVEAAFARVSDQLGGLDILVNNAGVGGPNGCAAEGPDRWDEIVRTNLDGTFLCSRAALRHMASGGRIVNISSVLGRFGVPGYTAYCASKHGVIGLTKALALELAGRGITANSICPGWVDTDMARDGMELMAAGMGVSFEEARRQALAQVPIGRIVQPAEVAELVMYMVGPQAAAMTGQAVGLCGGATMW